VTEVNKLSAVGILKIRKVIQLHEGDSYAEHYRWTSVPDGKGYKYILVNP